jgi:dihydrofolate reductase
MSKLVLSIRVSLDGLVARPGRMGAGGWGLPREDPSLKERKLEWMQDVGAHLMGRNTYEEMAEAWPTSDDPYAAPMNEIPKVVSRARSNAPSGKGQASRGVNWLTRSQRSSRSPARTCSPGTAPPSPNR